MSRAARYLFLRKCMKLLRKMNGGDLNENVDAAGMQNGMQKAKAPLTEHVLVHVELALEVRADHVELLMHCGKSDGFLLVQPVATAAAAAARTIAFDVLRPHRLEHCSC